jgi:hypothetical protein
VYQWYELRPNHIVNRTKCVTTVSDRVQQVACSGAATQRFRMRTIVRNSTTTIATFVDTLGRCMGVIGSNTTNGAQMQVTACSGQASQQVRLSPAGNHLFVLVLQHSLRCMDVPSSSTLDGTPLQQWTCHRTRNQVYELRRL